MFLRRASQACTDISDRLKFLRRTSQTCTDISVASPIAPGCLPVVPVLSVEPEPLNTCGGAASVEGWFIWNTYLLYPLPLAMRRSGGPAPSRPSTTRFKSSSLQSRGAAGISIRFKSASGVATGISSVSSLQSRSACGGAASHAPVPRPRVANVLPTLALPQSLHRPAPRARRPRRTAAQRGSQSAFRSLAYL